jgi:hypothetical protein
MSWDKSDDCITFYCDSAECDRNTSVTISSARTCNGHLTVTPPPPTASDFAFCWFHAKRHGWVSFKRNGQPWTYHCKECAAQAEHDHQEHQRNEAERERIKARNASR